MKDNSNSEGILEQNCEVCRTNFKNPPKYGEKVCEKCQPLWKCASQGEIDLVGQSPQELVMKLKKSESLNLEDGVQEAHSHEEEPLASNMANVDDEEEDSNESLDEHEKQVKAQLEQNIRNQQLQIKADKKIIIGSGFTFDMTDFFTFKKKKELASQGQGTFFDQISGGPIAWLILFYTVASGAIVPGWIMTIGATKFLRQGWRFLMQVFFSIPFMMYEWRTSSQEVRNKYSFAYITDKKNIIKPFISSLATTLFFLFILSSFEWTFVSHGIVLSSLSNFFLSIGRGFRSQTHSIESGGQVLVVLGLIITVYDTIMYTPEHYSEVDHLSRNTFYMRRTWWQRFTWDILAILVSLMLSEFSKYTSDLRNYYPPFLSMFIVNCFNVINLTLIAFFFNGSSFDLQPFWGVFSIFTDEHFASFMYMAIILSCGQMVSVFLVARMFPDPIIPALALTLDPYLASYFVQLTNVQTLPGDLSMMGYLFIFPGMLVILMGQCFFQRQKNYAQESDKRVQKLLDEIRELKNMNTQKENRATKAKRSIDRSKSQNVRITFGEHKRPS